MPACERCGDAIREPLCPCCVGREVAALLQERLPGRPELVLQLQDVTEELLSFDENGACIRCKHGMNHCEHCTIEHLYAWVKRAAPMLAQEYATCFGLWRERDEELRPIALKH